MNPFKRSVLVCAVVVSIITPVTVSSPVWAAILYKSYIVRQDRGIDILYDPYVVQKNDYVFKLFRQRGEIAEAEFSEFLEVFKRLNPHIPDVNTILPGQHI